MTQATNTQYDSFVAPTRSDKGTVVIPSGYSLDISKRNEAVLAINLGSNAEVKSPPVELPLGQKIIAYATGSVRLASDVDILNNRVCNIGGEYAFTLAQNANVTLTYVPRNSAGNALSPLCTCA